MSAEEQVIYQCQHCPNTYSVYSSFLQHTRQHSPDKAKSSPLQRTSSRSAKRDHHVVTPYSVAPLVIADFEEEDEIYEDFPCAQCDKIFPSQFNLRAHERWVHSDERFCCTRCPKTYPVKNWLVKHLLDVHADDPEHSLQCKHCKELFESESSLKLHIITHPDYRPHRCSACPRAFHFKSNMLTHYTNVHSDIRRFWCYICGEAFKKKLDLKTHVDLVHLGMVREQCPYCQKSLKDTGTLALHIKWVHDAEKLACKYCSRLFRSARNLERHVMGVHTKEKVPVDEIAAKRKKRTFINYGPVPPPITPPTLGPSRAVVHSVAAGRASYARYVNVEELTSSEDELDERADEETPSPPPPTDEAQVAAEKAAVQSGGGDVSSGLLAGPVREQQVRLASVRVKILTF